MRLIFILPVALWHCLANAQSEPAKEYVRFNKIDSLCQVDVFIGDQFFTAYRYSGGLLKKPVLFPLRTVSGMDVTRGYPIATRPGERVDHPHHYGLWFNHGDVNGIDFWNNSDAIPENRRNHYGAILHQGFIDIRDGTPGVLAVRKNWVIPSGDTILHERTSYTFSGGEHFRQIDHSTTLTATAAQVLFRDSKEGMFALRVARSLEQPDNERVFLTDSTLHPSSVKSANKEGVTGRYLNSEGETGDAVWGKRARWVKLSGMIGADSVAIVIFDYPENPNHPPHWMARGYGLFGVNPFGSKIYTDGKEALNFSLDPGKSVSFRHRVLIFDRMDPDRSVIEALYRELMRP